jgi:glycerophosphoryl diester phosphodiesterase
VDTPLNRPLLLGHRGARPLRRLGLRQRGVPAENTLTAFDYCMGHGCDGFELDVRYTRDRRHVLCHDPRHDGKEVADKDYHGLERRHGYNLPCLHEVLERFAATAYLDIELKVPGEEEAVVLAIHAHPPRRGFLVSSFLPGVLRRLHEIHAALPLGYICKHAEEAELWTQLPVRTFIPHYSLVTERLVREVHMRSMQLFTWTVNDREGLLRMAQWGVDGLISDDPKLLTETFTAASLRALTKSSQPSALSSRSRTSSG